MLEAIKKNMDEIDDEIQANVDKQTACMISLALKIADLIDYSSCRIN